MSPMPCSSSSPSAFLRHASATASWWHSPASSWTPPSSHSPAPWSRSHPTRRPSISTSSTAPAASSRSSSFTWSSISSVCATRQPLRGRVDRDPPRRCLSFQNLLPTFPPCRRRFRQTFTPTSSFPWRRGWPWTHPCSLARRSLRADAEALRPLGGTKGSSLSTWWCRPCWTWPSASPTSSGWLSGARRCSRTSMIVWSERDAASPGISNNGSRHN